MELSKAAIGMLAAGCVAAGSAGVYVATREAPGPEQATAGVATAPQPATAAIRQPEAAGRLERPSAAVQRMPERVGARGSAQVPKPAAATTLPPLEAPDAATGEADAPEPAAGELVETEPAPATGATDVQFEELVVPAESVLGLQVETALTSELAEVEDEVVARVTRDVRSGERVAIPSGSQAHGEVTLVERGGRLRERARLGIRFTTIVLPDGTRLPIETETILREGAAPGGESAAKIGGGAVGGAIIGGILGGARGAAIGGSVGAGAGTAAVLAGGRNAATLPTGTLMTVRLASPATVTVER